MVGSDHHAGTPAHFQKIEHALGQPHGAEIVQGNNQLQIAAGVGHTGTADQAVHALAAQGVEPINDCLPTLGGGKVCGDVSMIYVNIIDQMTLCPQILYGLGADAAGASGDCINAHSNSPLILRF